MGLNIGVCPEKEKNDKKEVILGYLMKHIKVSQSIEILYIAIPSITGLAFALFREKNQLNYDKLM